jgi:hypothetical protein
MSAVLMGRSVSPVIITRLGGWLPTPTQSWSRYIAGSAQRYQATPVLPMPTNSVRGSWLLIGVVSP